MTRKLHTKLAFNKDSHFFTNIKSISAYSLLVTMFALFTMTASMSPAQAELVDLSSPEPVIKFASQDASWLRPPNFDQVFRSMNNLISGKMVFSLRVDTQGSIRNVKVIECSGIKKIDNAFSRELQKARFKPFLREGKAVVANIELPIAFIAE